MSIRFATILAAALATASPCGASPFLDAANRLDGEWHGDGFVLKVDSIRAQASVDPRRPFQWQRFLVKEVTENEVVFTVGNELFEAHLEPEAITLSGTSFRGERQLRRALEGGAPSPFDGRGPLP